MSILGKHRLSVTVCSLMYEEKKKSIKTNLLLCLMGLFIMKEDRIKEAAYDRIEDIFNTSIVNIIEEAIGLEDKSPDEFLISLHFSFRQMLKKVTGTARRIEGLSELWYFLYIKKFLEKRLKVQFKTKELRVRDLVHYHFEAPYKDIELVLSSDISLEVNFDLKIHSSRKIRPDIFIGLRKRDMTVIPIAIIEIKLHQEDANNIKEVVNRFIDMRNNLTNQNIPLPYFIFLYMQHSQYKFKTDKQDKFNVQLERFKGVSTKSRLVVNRISKWEKIFPENKIEGSIYQFMTEVISSLEELSPPH